MDHIKIAETLAEKLEVVAEGLPDKGQEKLAEESELDPVHTLNFLKFFATERA
jgi:hypothetical protein